jgi:hypothetical protein
VPAALHPRCHSSMIAKTEIDLTQGLNHGLVQRDRTTI